MKKIFFYLLFVMALVFGGCESSIMPDPSTTIQYSLPAESHVKLTVENSYHTTIAVLVDGPQAAGYYQVLFNVSNLAEGLYFYTMEANGIKKEYYSKITKVMVLVK